MRLLRGIPRSARRNTPIPSLVHFRLPPALHTFAIALCIVCAAHVATAQSPTHRLRSELEAIHRADQVHRKDLGMFAVGTPQHDSLVRALIRQDSVNLVRVRTIIDSAGWLGPQDVGADASAALFLVIQHADLATQELYLPEARLAVEEGKLARSSLALLEDRIEVRNNRPQIYGSQVHPVNGTNVFYPIRDEATVNERRAAVGLGPLEEYAAHFGIVWSPPAPRERVLLLGPGK